MCGCALSVMLLTLAVVLPTPHDHSSRRVQCQVYSLKEGTVPGLVYSLKEGSSGAMPLVQLTFAVMETPATCSPSVLLSSSLCPRSVHSLADKGKQGLLVQELHSKFGKH